MFSNIFYFYLNVQYLLECYNVREGEKERERERQLERARKRRRDSESGELTRDISTTGIGISVSL